MALHATQPTDQRAILVPELLCSDLEVSLSFYVEILGFEVLYDRAEAKFAYLSRNGAELMLEQVSEPADDERSWLTASLETPYGRGVNFQIEVEDIDLLYGQVTTYQWPVFWPIEDKWYRVAAEEAGNRQFLVQDPDGYLLRLFEDLGVRKVVG